jgi:CBS domain-containing protein
MQVADVMSRNIEIITPDISLMDAANKMKKLDCGFLPIGENDRLVGMITDRDITIRAIADGKNPKKTTVRDAMTEDVKYCFESDDIKNAGKIMSENQIRRLVVLNKDKRAVGVCSIGDLVVKSHENEFAGEILEHISQPDETIH